VVSEAAERLAARAALGFTGASLPAAVGGEARLLAVACALRVGVSGFASLPAGVMRALRLAAPARAVAELQGAGWLYFYGRPRGGPAVFVPELAGQCGRRRGGHWGVQRLTGAAVGGLGPEARLAALLVAAWREPGGEAFRLDPEGAARSCGLSPEGLAVALDAVCAAGLLSGWGPAAGGLVECVP
jgi:hypothetical protein